MNFARALAPFAVAAILFAASPAAAQSDPAPSAEDELAGSSEPAPPPRRGPARPRMEIRPYIEVNAGVVADLGGEDGDVLTYSSVAAGVDGRIATRRVTAQASYRYERRVALEGDLGDDDSHSGVAMVHAEAAPGISLDAGAMATRTGGAGRPSVTSGNEVSAQVVSAYAGPTVNMRSGPVTIGAAYRLGYVRVDQSDELAGGFGGDDDFESVAHNATASVGMAPGRLPFGWTVGGGYVRDESGELENRFEGIYIRGDVVVPVGPTLAVTAGLGWETMDSSQLDVLRDSAGVPVLVGGRFVPDPTRPRLHGLDRSGLIYDAGIIWRPTPRTELQARAGRRYGGTTFSGSLQHRFVNGYGLSASVYDSVGTFGTTMINNVSNLPADFTANRNPLTGAFDGCVFGTDPGSGVCFDQALQSLSGGTFRGRGANILFSGNRGPWNFGLGAGYSHRRYVQLESGDLSSLDPRTDQSLALNASLGRRLSRYSGMSFNVNASWFDSDRPFFDPLFGTGATASYYRSFLFERLQFHAALGIFHSDGTLIDSTSASALLGLRYTF
ncbi:hypothetical protein [Allosphingosinicella sp.]|uniref:hypothetical protein n=1 Tax=Allosphingosinicella sp. TaxID=2823234 RepID=UPI002F0CC6D1